MRSRIFLKMTKVNTPSRVEILIKQPKDGAACNSIQVQARFGVSCRASARLSNF